MPRLPSRPFIATRPVVELLTRSSLIFLPASIQSFRLASPSPAESKRATISLTDSSSGSSTAVAVPKKANEADEGKTTIESSIETPIWMHIGRKKTRPLSRRQVGVSQRVHARDRLTLGAPRVVRIRKERAASAQMESRQQQKLARVVVGLTLGSRRRRLEAARLAQLTFLWQEGIAQSLRTLNASEDAGQRDR